MATYAEKNHGKITFHKCLAYGESPAIYNVVHRQLKGREIEKSWGWIGQAIEDFAYGLKDRYMRVDTRVTEESIFVAETKIKDFSEKIKKNTLYNTENPTKKQKPRLTDNQETEYKEWKQKLEDRKLALTKIQLTNAEWELVTNASEELVVNNPLGKLTGKKEQIAVNYKGHLLSGEMDELEVGDCEIEGRKYKARIADIKSGATFKLFYERLDDYIAQVSFYRFLTAIKYDLDPKDVCGQIKLVTKEPVPKSIVFQLSPETLSEHTGKWLEPLGKLIAAEDNDDFPELTWDEGHKNDEVYHLVKQTTYVNL